MIDLAALIPRAEDTLDAFPDEIPSDASVFTRRGVERAPAVDDESLLLFAPEDDRPTPAAGPALVTLRLGALRMGSAVRARLLSGIVWAAEVIVKGSRKLRAERITRSAFTGANAIMGAIVLLSAVSIVGLYIRQPALALLPVMSTPAWVPYPASVVASIDAARAASVPISERAQPSPVPSEPADRNDRMAIQRALNTYRDAFSILDPAMAKAVWPSADERALQQTFALLYDQSLEFDACRISVSAATASAICEGSVSYIRNQRPRRRQSEQKQWRFTLDHDGKRWTIRTAVEGA
jgi:hypothetical protein